MKAIVLLLALAIIAAVSAADETEVEDLGVITAKVGIVLEKDTERADWSHFVLEFLPQTPPTNLVTLTLTNDFLTLAELVRLPSGRVIMGVKSVCNDGTESTLKLYKFDIRRAGPPTPKARTIQILRGEESPEPNTLSNKLQRLRESRPIEPPPVPQTQPQRRGERGPIPPASEWPKPDVRPARALPLPGGRNETYAQHLDRMAEFYAKPGRRNE